MKAVITTINYPTEAVKEVAKRLSLVVIGDKKTPKDWHCEGVEYIPIEKQNDFNVSKFIPENHYTRKNIGYLHAIKSNPEFIYDVDDDNVPYGEWKKRELNVAADYISANGWANVYHAFIRQRIWPRGYPISRLNQSLTTLDENHSHSSSIQQGLSDIEADVDAIHRLFGSKGTEFRKDRSVTIWPTVWSPFNSQTTWFFPKAYPLMYLPVTASFRMCDIWRSFVAQRCLWEIGEGVTFHSPSEVFQKRNEHDLLEDFKDEVPGYLNNEKIVEVLGNLKLEQGVENVCDNLLKCYKELENAGIYYMHETRSVHAWIKDIKEIWKP